MAESARAQRQRKGLIVGGAMIAFGIVSAIFSYYRDSGSFNVVDMIHAGDFAILHVVLWTIAGLFVMAWYSISPVPRDRNDGTDSEAR
jgi:hypothetical protein